MTRPGGPGPDGTGKADDASAAAALELAEAVEELTSLWVLAAQQAPLRLSAHQLRALRALRELPGLNLTALADRMDIGLPTASRLCDRLEAAGLLERALHPHRRREVTLSLTLRGHRVLDDVAARRVRALAAVLTMMEPAEQAALAQGLRGFRTAAGRTGARRDGTPDTC